MWEREGALRVGCVEHCGEAKLERACDECVLVVILSGAWNTNDLQTSLQGKQVICGCGREMSWRGSGCVFLFLRKWKVQYKTKKRAGSHVLSSAGAALSMLVALPLLLLPL